jgi:hypothetical protein
LPLVGLLSDSSWLLLTSVLMFLASSLLLLPLLLLPLPLLLLPFVDAQVGDVFSAAALKALLEALTAEGVVVVTTSNRHPAELPRHGLHESMFGHFLNTWVDQAGQYEATEPLTAAGGASGLCLRA